MDPRMRMRLIPRQQGDPTSPSTTVPQPDPPVNTVTSNSPPPSTSQPPSNPDPTQPQPQPQPQPTQPQQQPQPQPQPSSPPSNGDPNQPSPASPSESSSLPSSASLSEASTLASTAIAPSATFSNQLQQSPSHTLGSTSSISTPSSQPSIGPDAPADSSRIIVGGSIAAIFVLFAVIIGLGLHQRRRRHRETQMVKEVVAESSTRRGRPASSNSSNGNYRKFDGERAASRSSTASRMSWFYFDGKKQPNSAFQQQHQGSLNNSSRSNSLGGGPIMTEEPVPPLPAAHTFHMEQVKGYGIVQNIQDMNTDGGAPGPSNAAEARWLDHADRSDAINIMGTYSNSGAGASMPEEEEENVAVAVSAMAGPLASAQMPEMVQTSALQGLHDDISVSTQSPSDTPQNLRYNPAAHGASKRDSFMSNGSGTPMLNYAGATGSSSPALSAPGGWNLMPISEDDILSTPTPSITAPASVKPVGILKTSGSAMGRRPSTAQGSVASSRGATASPMRGWGQGEELQEATRRPSYGGDGEAAPPSPIGNGNPFRRPTLPPATQQMNQQPQQYAPSLENPFGVTPQQHQSQQRHFTPPPVGNPFASVGIGMGGTGIGIGGMGVAGMGGLATRQPSISSRVMTPPVISASKIQSTPPPPSPVQQNPINIPSNLVFDPSRLSILTDSEYNFEEEVKETKRRQPSPPSMILTALNEVGTQADRLGSPRSPKSAPTMRPIQLQQQPSPQTPRYVATNQSSPRTPAWPSHPTASNTPVTPVTPTNGGRSTVTIGYRSPEQPSSASVVAIRKTIPVIASVVPAPSGVPTATTIFRSNSEHGSGFVTASDDTSDSSVEGYQVTRRTEEEEAQVYLDDFLKGYGTMRSERNGERN
ncbi:hypothetical protein HDU97_000724 [Phlyctochytrium planicorne]|nr:hypothetical protein HDU97_000724 [Phlyctochytrium planicorne]